MPSESEVMRHPPLRWLKLAGLIALGVAVVVVGGGLLSRGFATQKLKSVTAAAAIPAVSLVAPSAETRAEGLTLPGSVQANYNAVIHARVAGYLKRWYVDIGAHVKAGQVLADIDTPELDQQLAQAKAALATAVANQKFAQTTAARWTTLLSRDAVSHQEADEKTSDLQAKTTLVQAAKADVDRLQALESFKRIVAPFDGVVTARNTDVGALIVAGNASDPGLFTVADVRRLRIYVQVPQSDSAGLKVGESADITVPEFPGRHFQARLASTSDAIGAQSGAVLVELQMDNTGDVLKGGDYAQVSFQLPPATGMVRVPASAVMFRKKGMAVAVVTPDSRAALRYVTIGRDLGTAVEVASGLGPNERVIDNPPDSLVQGQLVRVVPNPTGREG